MRTSVLSFACWSRYGERIPRSLHVHRVRRLVADQDVGPQQHGARQRDRLTLPARQAFPALTHGRIISHGVVLDEFVMLAARAASRISSSVACGRLAVMLSRTVPENSTTSCAM